ncbi:MAG: DNA topoisomerase IB, partial [bacterium]
MTKEIKLNKSLIRAAVKDASQSAKAVNLVYVSERHLCIEREGKTNKFYYTNEKVKINDEENLARIKKLAIPPAWKNVRIC